MDEIRSYLSNFPQVLEVVRDVIFWRNTSIISLRSYTFHFPLRSFLLFIIGLIILRFPSLLPSSLTGLFLALFLNMMRSRRSEKNPWMRCPSVHDLTRTLLFNDNMNSVTIAVDPSYEHQEDEPVEIVEYDNDETKSVRMTMRDVPSENKSPSKFELALDIFKPNLFSLQQQLIATIEWIRIMRRILTWEEAVLSFWLSLIFLIVTVIFLFIPWLSVLRFFSTVFVWTFLSPLMKLIDVIFFQDILPSNHTNSSSSWKQSIRAAVFKFTLRSRIRREAEVKSIDMKQYLFGSYSIRIPRLSVDLVTDFPLPTSKATPLNSDPVSLAVRHYQDLHCSNALKFIYNKHGLFFN